MNKFVIDNDPVRIESFLQKVDACFTPALSSRVVIADYASKLASNAENVFLEQDGRDIAQASLYVNDLKSFKSFLSSICVAPECRGGTYASELLLKCLSIAKCHGMEYLKLEVSIDNKRAISFYQRNGFAFDSEKGTSIVIMQRILSVD